MMKDTTAVLSTLKDFKWCWAPALAELTFHRSSSHHAAGSWPGPRIFGCLRKRRFPSILRSSVTKSCKYVDSILSQRSSARIRKIQCRCHCICLAILAQGVLHPVSRSDGIDESGSSRISSTSCTATAFGECRLRQRVAVGHLDLIFTGALFSSRLFWEYS
jgi:hypothetical protein